MSQPLVSIIIPVYKSQHNIKKLAEKILSQAETDLELILVNDKSPDDSLAIINKLAKSDARVAVVNRAKNGGPSAARNSGLDVADGKYIMFFDSDDDFDANMIKIMTEEAKRSAADVVVCGWKMVSRSIVTSSTIELRPSVISGNQSSKKTAILRSMANGGQLYNLWNKIFNAKIIKNNQVRFREDLRFGEDLLFSLEYFEYAQKIKLISPALYYYLEDSSTSVFSESSLNFDFRQENSAALRKFIGESPTEEILELYNWILCYWMISYFLHITDAKNLNIRSKLKLIKTVLRNKDIVYSKSGRYLSKKQLVIEYLLKIITLNSLFVLITFKFVNIVRDISKIRAGNKNVQL